MSDTTYLLAAGLIFAYALLILILARQDRSGPMNPRWLEVALIAALASTALRLLPEDAAADSAYEGLFVGELTLPALAVIAGNLMLVLFGAHVLRFLQIRLVTLWTLLGLAWCAGQAALSVLTEQPSIGQAGWYTTTYEAVEWPSTVAFVGWLAIGVILVLVALFAFYKARLPEIANRALFASLLVPPVVGGLALGASGEDVLAELGWILQCAGLVGAVYSARAYRVLDLRRTFRQTTATTIVTLITALVFFAALVAAQELDRDTRGLYAIMAALAVGGAAAYLPFRSLAQRLIDRLFGSTPATMAGQLREFSEDIAGVVELDELVDVTMRTLSQTLHIRRGGLILVGDENDDHLEVVPVPHGMGEMPDIKGEIKHSGPVCGQLTVVRRPLLQYDLDFSPLYATAAPGERHFFQQLRMSAYAPVILEGQLVGILGCGAKTSDTPFTEHELELLMTIANQAGVALRNARLIDDLRRREAEQADLNRALSNTKEQLEKLDSVKTDFITIASHELRTPLAQIRGYTDIMEAMNDEGMLDQDQIGSMTSNLRKAADRLENLIAAMLDVSQLDVDAMDLRFTQVSIEQLMRMAIEPLNEAIRSRKLMLSARGLRDLPPIQGDQQRLVQAFRNIVLNAIKFTPDGGRIDITGRVQDDMALILIKDTGIGIDPANHELIFEKFFRAQDPSLHSTGATKFMGAGPGLGLTIARGVITAHGGKIWVESTGFSLEKLPGTTFLITLPVTRPAEARRPTIFDSTISLGHREPRMILGTGEDGGEEPAAATMLRPPAGLQS